MNKFVFCVILLAVGSSAYVEYPMYKQCDTAWRNNYMGSKTICQVGCLMSSVSMALAGRDYMVTGCQGYKVIPTPESVNCFLRANNGYSGNNLYWGKVTEIGDDISLICHNCEKTQSKLDYYLNADYVVLLNVKSGGHWVLATRKKDSSTYYVNDPSSRTEYSYSEVYRYAVYQMKMPDNPSDPPTHSYPKYSACDYRWKNDKMEDKTLCQMGSLVSSAAMSLAGRGFKINGATITPQNLNSFFRSSGGYGGGNLLGWHAMADLDSQIKWQARVRESEDMTWINEQLGKDFAVFGHYGDQKWCLIKDAASSTRVNVNCPDSSSKSTMYPSDFTGYLVYEMGTSSGKSNVVPSSASRAEIFIGLGVAMIALLL